MDLLAVIRTASGRLAGAAASRPGASVPRYPGWTLLDLLIHTGSAHRRATKVVATTAQEKVEREFPPDEVPEVVLPWFTEGVASMVEALERADPISEVWGFGPRPTVASWILRMALETEVHRWDAECAMGSSSPIPAWLAAAGIEELLALWGGVMPLEQAPSLELVLTDLGESWTLSAGEVGARLAPGSPSEPGDAVEGDASEIYLWLMGRRDLAGLVCHGSGAVVWDAAFRALPDARR
ncbi:MAG: maleylpyruvate isomerase family mycothiol-dependent enzyme [Acidimicrobiia bacterium]|nr:MAG: maleylpyruvate isomerase family mycothiol-dependent enzyme [Acidimicrobiia bacterium]